MRIAYVTETWPPELNGVALTAARTVQRLRSRGHVVQVVRPRQAGDVGVPSGGDELLLPGVRLPMYRDLQVGLPFARPLKQAWQSFEPQLVHIATEGPLAWAALRAGRSRRATVTSDYRTRFDLYGRYYGFSVLTPVIRRYLRAFHNRCDLTCVPAPDLIAELLAQGFENLEVHGRGIDVERFAPAWRDETLRRSWGERGPFVLSVGRLAREKNLELLAQSFEAIRARQPGARLIVVGDGPMRGELERRLPDALFCGHRSGADLAQIYASADLFLFPSLTDTFGNVVLEALASGLPTVAFDRAAANMHMSDGVDGRVIATDDPAGFIIAAVSLAADATLRAHLSVNARGTALALGWDSVLDRFEASLMNTCAVPETGIIDEYARLA
ncbi:glycosyltransferase family 1 protein [soil metagenome]